MGFVQVYSAQHNTVNPKFPLFGRKPIPYRGMFRSNLDRCDHLALYVQQYIDPPNIG